MTEDVFEVTISGSVATQHEVTITDIAHHYLTRGRATKEELLDFSFKFLLEREPNTSILGKFEITVICQYFPEYKTELPQILS